MELLNIPNALAGGYTNWGQSVGNNLLRGRLMGQEQEQKNALAAALQGGDAGAITQALAPLSPTAAIAYQQGNERTKQDQLEQKRGMFLDDTAGVLAGTWKLPAEQRQAAFAAQEAALAKKYPEFVQGEPEAWDDAAAQSHALALATHDKRYADVFARVGLLPQEPAKTEGFTLGEGQVRYGPDGQQLAKGPDKSTNAQVISAGGALVGPGGQVLYRNPFKPESDTTSSYRDFLMSQNNPEYAKFLASKGGGGLTVDPETGAVTAGTFKAKPIPAEIGTRMALGTSWASQVPDILASIEEGTTSGLNRAGMALGAGNGAAVARRQQSGVDALVRSLTGAGMNLQEAQKYAGRYEIQANDKTETQRNKVLQLAQELRTIDNSVSKQYGQPPSKAYEGIPTPPNLSDELGKQSAIPAGWSVQEH
jgi:hypothetical protein